MRRQGHVARRPNLLTRAVQGVFDLVRLAEFEILFVVFLVIVLLLIKDLVSTGRKYCICNRMAVHLSIQRSGSSLHFEN
jgi:hypothetical protein